MISATRSIHVQYKGGKILKSTCILNCEQINMHIESVHFKLVAKVAGDLSKFEDYAFTGNSIFLVRLFGIISQTLKLACKFIQSINK